MRCFFKYFAIALILQIILLPLILFTGIGESIIYLFYIFPIILFRPPDSEKVEISIFVLMIPATVIYSVIFSVVVCAIGKVRNKFRK